MFKQFIFPVFFSLILFLTSFSACNKTSDLGFDLIPEEFLFDPNALDTFTVNAFTYKSDSVRTSGMSNMSLGTYTDPIFGNITASFISEMRPLSPLDKGTAPVFDSLVMYLHFDSLAYGNPNTEKEINIFEIKQRLNLDSAYYNTFKYQDLETVLITTATFLPFEVLIDSIMDDTVKIKNPLYQKVVIKLDSIFGKRIFDDYDLWNGSLFVNYFNGFLFKPESDPIDGSLSRFDLSGSNSEIIMYYHKNDTTAANYTFSFKSNCTRISLTEHEYNAPGFLPDLENPGIIEDSVVYIQGMAGLETRIFLPYLDQLKNQGIFGVNRAELIIQAELEPLTFETLFPAPSQLLLYSINADGNYDYLQEYYTQQGYIGAQYNDGKYIFDITYLIQKIIKGDIENNGLVIKLQNDYFNHARAVLTSGKHSRPMKLSLSLTKL